MNPGWRTHAQRQKSLAERFWEKVDKSADCWLWMGARNSRGYGVIQVAGHAIYAHRLVLELAGRPLASGMFACHTCDNPPCVRPDHLFAGTNSENILDAGAKGRLPTEHGPTWRANLSASLRKMRAAHPIPLRDTCRRGHPLTGDNVALSWDRRRGREHRRCRECDNARHRAR
jgi:hypothetical protein